MTRDEAKVLMRQALEKELNQEQRVLPLPNYNGLSCNDLMAEVEKGSELGETMLNEFILDMNEEARKAGLYPTMDQSIKSAVVSLMQKDIDTAPEGWAERPIAVDDKDNELTPLQVIQQVKDGTDWGNRYAATWLDRYRMWDAMDRLQEVVGAMSPAQQAALDNFADTLIGKNSPGSNSKLN